MSREVVYDFHMHTFLGDGALLPSELIRRCIVSGYAAMAITEHAGPGIMQRVIQETRRDCAAARDHWDFEAYAGVELTHVPADTIANLAETAKEYGAAIVVVHGETPAEPVQPGTNLAAAHCPAVDILAHPGMISTEAAQAARENGVFLEVTARHGHNVTNGHVVQVALNTETPLLVNSDTHAPGDILTPAWAHEVAQGAGIPQHMLDEVLVENPIALLDRIRANVGSL